ncbi:MAG: PDR/VanB family oxidoreductase [Hydrogenophaga sp.]|jgi:ferredoxin-NADP reductase|uniref:PDR/VanB family oxidoreductase n=1 Tax=Hydrogenophaga sp. TaxID=1904254 RepID=UPI00262F622A|nr:PDR/VanB family oxidoreductase [Hydrogenophaga sp.]MCV0440107.1 PDR/VanB family oxidoreductase [Hydrogenophaga sp.]
MKSNPNWQSARIHALRDLTPTVREFVIAPIEGAPERWAPGAHLLVQVILGGRPQTRSYSLVGLPGEVPGYRIAVKRLDDGHGGSRAMWQLAEGDAIEIGAPQNHFPLGLQAPATLLVAGGIGITPMVSMAQALVRRGQPVRLLYAARSEAELAYGESLRALLGDGLVACVSERGERLDLAGEIATLAPGAQAYVCGPAGLLGDLRGLWAAAGRPLPSLRFETFGSGGRLQSASFRVEVPRHKARLEVRPDQALIDVLEDAGIEVMSDCRRGECGLCAMDVLALDGEIDHRDVFLSEHEKQENKRICACVSRVVGRITLDTAWRPETVS